MCIKKIAGHALMWLLMSLSCFSQGEPIENLSFSQLSFGKEDALKHFSPIGMVSFDYVPPDNIQYLNMMAYGPFNNEPYWILRNVMLIGKAQNPLDFDSKSVRFPMDSAGYPKALPGMNIFYNYMLTPQPMTIPYDFTSLPVFRDTITTYSINIGWGNTGAASWNDTLFANIIWIPPFTISNFFYYGCEVPNYDLNGVDDKNGCGPAAAANSMCWMESRYSFDIPGGIGSAYSDFNNLMGRMPENGVSFADFIRAKLDFIEMYDLPIIVEYQVDNGNNGDQISSSSGNSSATCKNTGIYPDKNWFNSQGQAGADIEAWVNVQNSTGMHIITITGGCTVNGTINLVTYKHDNDQTQSNEEREEDGEKPGTTQESHYISVGDGGRMYIDGFTFEGITKSAPISRLVSERYNPNHKPRPKKLNLKKFCDCQYVTVPPNSTITFSYPTDNNRGFNCTVYSRNMQSGTPSTSSTFTKVAEWNNNSGQDRTYENKNSFPQMLSVHNDDVSQNYTTPAAPYSVDFSVASGSKLLVAGNDIPQETSKSNPEVFAGFSLGFGDGSPGEFGDIQTKDVSRFAGIGCRLCDIPSRLGGAVKSLKLEYPIAEKNVYWDNLELRLTVDSIVKTGKVKFTVLPLVYSDTLEIDSTGDFIKKINTRVFDADTFTIVLEPLDGTEFIMDFIAVAPIAKAITTGAITNTEFCAGDIFGIDYALFNKLPEDVVFKAMLSDKTGNFEKPIVIGTLVSNESGTIKCLIPENCIEGNNYRVRIESEEMESVGTDNGYDFIIFSKPEKPVISQTGDTLNSGTNEGNQWLFGNEIIEGAVNKELIPEEDGYYRVIVTSEHGCVSDTSEAYEYKADIESVEENENEPVVYWNSRAGKLVIQNIPTIGYAVQISVYNVIGKQVLNKFVYDESVCELYLKDETDAGLYFVQIKGYSTKLFKVLIY